MTTASSSGREVLPVPDPSTLTTAQTIREIDRLEALLTETMQGIVKTFETRFMGMDKAIELIQAAADRVPSEVDLKVGYLKELHGEKFHSIDVQFAERDDRTKESATERQKALDAALQAQKEAAGKIEDRVAKLESRLDRSEGQGSGQDKLTTLAFGVIATIGVIVAVVASIAALTR